MVLVRVATIYTKCKAGWRPLFVYLINTARHFTISLDARSGVVAFSSSSSRHSIVISRIRARLLHGRRREETRDDDADFFSSICALIISQPLILRGGSTIARNGAKENNDEKKLLRETRLSLNNWIADLSLAARNNNAGHVFVGNLTREELREN